jgi:hypothetical protein
MYSGVLMDEHCPIFTHARKCPFDCYDYDVCPHCSVISHDGDAQLDVYKLVKTQFTNLSFKELAETIHFRRKYLTLLPNEIKWYKTTVDMLADKNNELSSQFVNNKVEPPLLSDLIVFLDIVTFIKVPNILEIPVINGHLVDFDGNWKCAVFESVDSFFVVLWSSS